MDHLSIKDGQDKLQNLVANELPAEEAHEINSKPFQAQSCNTNEVSTIQTPPETSSVVSPCDSYNDNPQEPLNLSTDVEFTDSENETRHHVTRNQKVQSAGTSVVTGATTGSMAPSGGTGIVNKSQFNCTSAASKILSSSSPQRNIMAGITPLNGGLSPTRNPLPEGLRDNISAMIPAVPSVRVKVRSRHASFSTPPKSPADSNWRLFKVNRDMKEEAFDDINGERNFTQSLCLKNQTDSKLSVSDKEEETFSSSCPSSPRHIGSPRGSITACSPRSHTSTTTSASTAGPCRSLPGRSSTPSPSPPFTTTTTIPRCVSPIPGRPNSFTLKRKIVDECASPPKRPCTMGLGHRSPTVEYRARNHSPAPLSPLAVSSQSVPEGEAVRTVPLHILDKIELPQHFTQQSDSSDNSSDDSPPRPKRQPG